MESHTHLLFSVPDAAKVLALSRSMVYNLIARGEIRTLKIGRATRIPFSELERFVQELSEAQHNGNR